MDFNVLIVDDDPKIAEIHHHFTEKVAGFSVCEERYQERARP